MSLDIHLLQALKDRKRYDSLHSYIPKESYDVKTITMLQWFGLYFKTYPNAQAIEPDALFSMIKLKGNLTQEQAMLYGQLVNRLREDVQPEIINNTIDMIEDCSAQIKSILSRYDANEEVDVVTEIALITETTKQRKKSVSQSAWADGDVMDYISAMSDDFG